MSSKQSPPLPPRARARTHATPTHLHQERYPTTEDDDTALMSDRKMFKGLPQNARNAIRLRRTEKRLLKVCCHARVDL